MRPATSCPEVPAFAGMTLGGGAQALGVRNPCSGAPRHDEEGAAAVGAVLDGEAGDGRPDGDSAARNADAVTELRRLHEAERPCPAFVY